MQLSAFGEKLSSGAGILSLMDDLGKAMADGDLIMMGGGNPGHIPAIQEVVRARLQAIIDDGQALRRAGIGIYDPPRGDRDFRRALAALLRREYGWDPGEDNICLTNGSQGAFFLLFNLLAGRTTAGGRRKIPSQPLAPEAIGYADLGIEADLFVAVQPRIEMVDETYFKYRVDFDRIEINEEIGAICVSRPTNPTGNVLTDDEVAGLAELAAAHDIPLIVDGAYGLLFPGMVYTRRSPRGTNTWCSAWSLSGFGSPACRTGIVIAKLELIRAWPG